LSAAEDLVQEAFMKLQAQFKEVREPRRWLYRTVHNLALNHQRQARKIVPLEPTARGRLAAETADPRRCRMSKLSARKASAWCG
jgi:DNA-directed RNA polymerase specialized sigma24 family protein